MKRTAYDNPNMPPVTWALSWGINLEGVKDLCILSGHAAIKRDNSSGVFPGDPVAQTRYTLEQLELTFSQAGYTKHDIVSVSWCVTKEVTDEQAAGMLEVWRDYIADIAVKPAGGTWKVIYGLISSEIQVEIEMTLAR